MACLACLRKSDSCSAGFLPDAFVLIGLGATRRAADLSLWPGVASFPGLLSISDGEEDRVGGIGRGGFVLRRLAGYGAGEECQGERGVGSSRSSLVPHLPSAWFPALAGRYHATTLSALRRRACRAVSVMWR